MNKRARHKAKQVVAPRPTPRAPLWRRPVVWLGSIATAAVLASLGVVVPSVFAPDLRVMEEIRYVLSIPDRQIRDGVERQLLTATVCVKNHGLLGGALKRAEVSRGSLARVPEVEIISLDQKPIRGWQARPVQIQFMLTSPFTFKDTSPIHWRLDLYDEGGKFVGVVNGIGEHTPAQPGSKPSGANIVPRTAPPDMCDATR